MPSSVDREFSPLHSEVKPDLMSATNRTDAIWWLIALFAAVLFVGFFIAMETNHPNIPVEQMQTVNPNISAPSNIDEPNGAVQSDQLLKDMGALKQDPKAPTKR
jgi:hypothetical protein